MVPSTPDIPSTKVYKEFQFRITMAAIDPSAKPHHDGIANGDTPARATLKMLYRNEKEEPDDDEDEDLRILIEGQGSDEDDEDESSSDDEEKNGGPSDPSKTKKARKQAAAEQLMRAVAAQDSDDDMEVGGANGISTKQDKGKGRATSDDEEDDEDDEEDGSSDYEIKEVVLCTLDPQKNCQQPLDLTIDYEHRAYFKVSGTHAVYLTGNYVVIPPNAVESPNNRRKDPYDLEDELYDLSSDEDELDDEDEEDELDDLEDPRITEIDSESEEAPKLVKNEPVKSKGENKRPAPDSDEEPTGLDDMVSKSLNKAQPTVNGEKKLSKKQLKKLKNNAGKPVNVVLGNKDGKKDEPETKDSPATKADKKVQFAKNLEQGPIASPKDVKHDSKAGANGTKPGSQNTKASLGIKTLEHGVKIDDRKLGKGPACKKGDTVGLRYIGKLQDGKVFDANKKGVPYRFKLGAGEVIKGWDIGVVGMSVGGERRVDVPASMAYGNTPMPGIPRGSPLRFDVKLLEIK
ncbi:MAG: hypothetical protein Q9167_003690 [Letrouitia subvulpina]